jgi:hypothetical protein
MADLKVSERAGPETVEDAASAIARLGNSDPDGFSSVDVMRDSDPTPLLSILVSGPWCAIHYTDAPDGHLLILENPTPEDAPEEVWFRYVEGRTRFTRPYIHPLATARRYIEEFASDETVGGVPAGSWIEL